jgi:hypothetical protein
MIFLNSGFRSEEIEMTEPEGGYSNLGIKRVTPSSFIRSVGPIWKQFHGADFLVAGERGGLFSWHGIPPQK